MIGVALLYFAAGVIFAFVFLGPLALAIAWRGPHAVLLRVLDVLRLARLTGKPIEGVIADLEAMAQRSSAMAFDGKNIR